MKISEPKFIHGVTRYSVGPFGMRTTFPPAYLFATRETAEEVAKVLGLILYEATGFDGLDYDGMGNIVPVYMMNFDGNPLSAGINCGMAARVMWNTPNQAVEILNYSKESIRNS